MSDMTQNEADDFAKRMVDQAMKTAYPDATGRLLLLETAVYAIGQVARHTRSERFGADHPLTVAYQAVALRAGVDAYAHTDNLLMQVLSPVTPPAEVENRLQTGETGAQARTATDYVNDVSDFADLMTVDDFRSHVVMGAISDYDGSAYPVRDGKEARDEVSVDAIPDDATHVAWYNK